MNCANTKDVFRIIQSVLSKRAEPFKLWLAKFGQERIEEIENPELAQDRVKEYYELKGYPKNWIDKRIGGIAVRQDLTDEWKEMGIKKSDQFMVFGEAGTVILKKIETPAIKKTFDEIAKPLREAAKQAGLTRADVKKAIKDLRNSS